MTKKIIAIVLSMALLITAFGITPNVEAAKKTKKITLTVTKKTLKVGGKFTLRVKKVTPKKANKKVTWKSSKPAFATVKSGKVTAKKVGVTKIIATSKVNKKVKAICTVTVIKNTVAPKNNSATTRPTSTPTPTASPEPTANIILPADSLKENANFKVGTVISPNRIASLNFTALAKQQFDMVAFENQMKPDGLLDISASQQNSNGMPVCKFTESDMMMDWAKENGLNVRGHVLFWAAQTPDEFFRVDYSKDKDLVDKDTLLRRMESYAMSVISHFETKYPGIIIEWDTVNEAIDSSKAAQANGLRLGNNRYLEIVGQDYVLESFKAAKNAVTEATKTTGTKIELFYNDYNTFEQAKTDCIIALIYSINNSENGKLLDCMGMQGYINYDWPSVTPINDNVILKAMKSFQATGVKVGITELTVRLNEHLSNRVNLWGDESPALTEDKIVSATSISTHAKIYKDAFTMYNNFYKTFPDAFSGVTIWGLFDRPDLEPQKMVIGKDRFYDYNIYGTHSGLFKSSDTTRWFEGWNVKDFEPKKAFNDLIAMLKASK